MDAWKRTDTNPLRRGRKNCRRKRLNSPAEHRRLRDEVLARASSESAHVGQRRAAEDAAGGPTGDESTIVVDREVVAGVGRPTSMAQAHWEAGVPRMAPAQGAEIFTANAQASDRKRPLVALAVVAALALVGGAVWWLAFSGDDGDTAPAAPPPTTSALAAAVAAVPELPGQPRDVPQTMSPADLGERGLFPTATAEEIARVAGGEVGYRGSTRDGATFAVTIIEGAHTEALGEHQAAIGLTPVTDSGLPAEVAAYRITTAEGSFRRAVYRSGDLTVMVDASLFGKTAEKELTSAFTEVATKVTTALPAT